MAPAHKSLKGGKGPKEHPPAETGSIVMSMASDLRPASGGAPQGITTAAEAEEKEKAEETYGKQQDAHRFTLSWENAGFLLEQKEEGVTAEKEREEEFYRQITYYCRSGSDDLTKSVSDGEAKVPRNSAALEEKSALDAQLREDLAEHKTDRKDAKIALDKNTEKEADTYAEGSSDAKNNMALSGRATAAIEKRDDGSFAQVSTRMTVEMNLSPADRDILNSFLTGDHRHAPQDSEVTSIPKQMLGDHREGACQDGGKRGGCHQELREVARWKGRRGYHGRKGDRRQY